jgi:hypothetical protein
MSAAPTPEAPAGRPRDPVTGLVTPPPVQMNARRIVAGGTAIWAAAFVVLLCLHHRLVQHHHTLWMWSCLAGAVLGALGWTIMTRHRRQGRTI